MADILEQGELLLILGVGAFIIYALYKAKQAAPSWTDVSNYLSQLGQNISNTATNVQQNIGASISPSLRMFALGSGVSPNGNTWSATSGAVMTVNGIAVGLSDRIGPAGQTVGTLLNDGWTDEEIADYVVMSGTVPAQALNTVTQPYQVPGGIVTLPVC